VTEALSLAQRAVQLTQDDPQPAPLDALAAAHAAVGNFDQAIAAAEAAMELASSAPPLALAGARMRIERYRQSKAYRQSPPTR